eukprot:8111498-Alexandrium_andersonii.AAC.1
MLVRDAGARNWFARCVCDLGVRSWLATLARDVGLRGLASGEDLPGQAGRQGQLAAASSEGADAPAAARAR